VEISALLARVDGVRIRRSSRTASSSNSDSGEEIWISLSVTRMLNRDKEVMGEVFNCSNITKRKQLESQLHEKNAQLLRLVITDSLTGLYNVRHLNAEFGPLIRAQKALPQPPHVRGPYRRWTSSRSTTTSKGHQAAITCWSCWGTSSRAKSAPRWIRPTGYAGDGIRAAVADTKIEGAKVICERVLSAFRKLHAETHLPVHRIAQLSPGDETKEIGHAVDRNSFQRADEAMYAVKCKGGKRPSGITRGNKIGSRFSAGGAIFPACADPLPSLPSCSCPWPRGLGPSALRVADLTPLRGCRVPGNHASRGHRSRRGHGFLQRIGARVALWWFEHSGSGWKRRLVSDSNLADVGGALLDVDGDGWDSTTVSSAFWYAIRVPGGRLGRRCAGPGFRPLPLLQCGIRPWIFYLADFDGTAAMTY
jgi:GGDEF domain-containing protein